MKGDKNWQQKGQAKENTEVLSKLRTNRKTMRNKSGTHEDQRTGTGAQEMNGRRQTNQQRVRE